MQILVVLGSPTMSLVVPGPETRPMVKNGLLQVDERGAFARITAPGLRALADEMDKGRVASALERMKAEIKASVAAKKAASKS